MGKDLKMIPLYVDHYKRTIAIILMEDGSSLQEQLLESGAAWVYPKYCTRQECIDWKQIEYNSKEDSIGLWSDNTPIPPWIWRKHKR